MFWTRLISGICLLAILAVCLVFGGNVLLALCIFISAVGFYEMMKVTGALYEEPAKEPKEKNGKAEGKKPGIESASPNGQGQAKRGGGRAFGGLYYVGMTGIVIYYMLLALSDDYQMFDPGLASSIPMLCVTGIVLAVLIVYVLTFPKYKAPQIMASVFAFMYAPVMLSYIYRTRCLENGAAIVWLIFISSWMCDTSAYAVGMLIGKHKMAPRLSPKKSVEGGIGGIVGAALLGCLYGWILKNMGIMVGKSSFVYPLLAGAGGMISQIGDLAASAIKRNYDIKDYGHLIPGHGGILDRFDSVIFTAPIIYYLAVLLV